MQQDLHPLSLRQQPSHKSSRQRKADWEVVGVCNPLSAKPGIRLRCCQTERFKGDKYEAILPAPTTAPRTTKPILVFIDNVVITL